MKLVDYKVSQFVDVLATDAPTPGGGSTAALVAALGVALTSMVAALTVGRKKYAQFEELMEQNLILATELKVKLLAAIDKDVEAFNVVGKVFSMPKETDAEKLARKTAMEEALKGAVVPPYEMMELSLQCLLLTETMLNKSNATAVSDLGVAALNLKAAVQSGWLNVIINVNAIEDKAFAQQYRLKGEAILKQALPLADEIYKQVFDLL